jgi:hypothetical protein
MDQGTDDFIVIPKGTILACDSNGYLIPATGTSNVTDTYTTMDVNAGVKNSAGTLATAGETYTRTARKPIGVAMYDIYQNIAGKYLNYRQQTEISGMLCEGVIDVPYFTFEDLGEPTSEDAAAALVKAKVGGLAYGPTNAKNLTVGDLVMPDGNGKFVQFDTANASYPSPDELAYVVGKVILVDTDFPKDYLQYVQTYPMSAVAGTETGGMPNALANVGATRMVRIRLTF